LSAPALPFAFFCSAIFLSRSTASAWPAAAASAAASTTALPPRDRMLWARAIAAILDFFCVAVSCWSSGDGPA